MVAFFENIDLSLIIVLNINVMSEHPSELPQQGVNPESASESNQSSEAQPEKSTQSETPDKSVSSERRGLWKNLKQYIGARKEYKEAERWLSSTSRFSGFVDRGDSTTQNTKEKTKSMVGEAFDRRDAAGQKIDDAKDQLLHRKSEDPK